MGSHSVVLPSSRWLMSVVDSLDDRCSPECPGAMRRLGAMRSLSSPARCRASFLSACRRSCRGSSLNGGVSYKACCHETSPCPVVGEIPVCPGCRLKSASGGFGCYFGTTPQFEIPTRPNRNIFRNSQNLFLIA